MVVCSSIQSPFLRVASLEESPEDAQTFLDLIQDPVAGSVAALLMVLKRRGHLGGMSALRGHRSTGLCQQCEILKKELALGVKRGKKKR